MARKNRLEPERMTDGQLWDRAFVLIARAFPNVNQGPHDLDLLLQQLKAVLQELELRGEQLALFPETQGTRNQTPTEWHG